MFNSKENHRDMMRFLTTLFIAYVSMTANMAVAQQHDTQPKDIVQLHIVNEQVTKGDGKASNIVKLESEDERLFVQWDEEDTVYHIFTADTIFKLEPTTPQGTKLVLRGANQDKAGISCWHKPNVNAAAKLDPDKSHTLRDDNTLNRVTILRLNENTHPDGIELEFAQERGNGVKARLWRVKPWSKEMSPLPIKIYIKHNNCNSPSSLIEDSIFTLAATDTLKSISIEWSIGKNYFSPTLKIDNKECELKRDLTDNIDSLLRKEGEHMIQFECKMFVSDEVCFKLEPYIVEYRIERLASNGGFFWHIFWSYVCSYWQVLLAIIILVFFPLIWRFGKRPNTPAGQANSQDGGNSPEVKGTDVREKNTKDPQLGNGSSRDSVGEDNKSTELRAHFEVNMKKDELLKQLQTLINVLETQNEPQKPSVVSNFLEKFIFKQYAQNRIQQQGTLEESCRLLNNLHGVLNDGVVDIADFNELKDENVKLNRINCELERSRNAARKAAENLYKEQLLFLLERLYTNYVCNTSNNERLKTLAALFDKEIDPSNPADLAGRFNQKQINVLLAEFELCFVSVNKKADWCKKYGITYKSGESLDNFVNDIYNKGYEKGRTAVPVLDSSEIDILKKKLSQLSKENNALAEENNQSHSTIEFFEKQVLDLNLQLQKTQTELENRPVIQVPVSPEEFETEKAELVEAHKKEIDALNKTIKDLDATITELKTNHKEEIRALETKHKEETDTLKKVHREQLTTIDAEHKQLIFELKTTHKNEIDALNETIKGLDLTITELKTNHKEEISALEAKHKEETDTLKKVHREQLATIDAEHKQEIADLNAAYKKETDILNTTIGNLELTIAELKEKQKDEIAKLEKKREEQLDEIQAKHIQAINEVRQSHAEEVKELVAKPNGWCNEFIAEVRQQMNALAIELQTLQSSVEKSPNTDRPIFVSAVKEMTQFFGVFETNVKKICDEKSNQDQIDLPAIRESLLTMFGKVLNYSGSWANRLLLLESYSRVPQLADQMQSRGVDVATIERAAAIAKALFAKTGFSIVEPAVLAAPYKSDCYDFENNEVLIYRFFPEVSPQDYSGRIFDLVRVGYNVVGGDHKNPVVVYF